jgi:hypothetical protein
MISRSGRKRVAVSAIRAKTQTKPKIDHVYDDLLRSVDVRFGIVTSPGGKLFRTDADGLWDVYLKNLPASERQFHNCHCCRRFIETYGALVAIEPDGSTSPAMWNPKLPGADNIYAASFHALFHKVKNARVASVFFSKETVWGNPTTPGWTHLSVTPPRRLVFHGRLETPGQMMAANKENYRNVMTALAEFKPAMLDEALRVLKAEALNNAEKFIAPVQWLRDLHERPKGKFGENVVWRAIADAPEGYCHPRASMVGSLLEDIQSGLPFQGVKARFDAKVAPLRYQRPQAAPAAGNIAAAEKIVEKLGIARSLERRFARLEDLETIWTPRDVKPQNRGRVFGHLKAKQETPAAPLSLPCQKMTWRKFSETVLPEAVKIEIRPPYLGSFIAMTAAAHADAPPILKWDREDRRNSVAWYFYHQGSTASQWGLAPGEWAKINAVAPLPTMWGDKPMPFISEGVVLVIEGAVDSRNSSSGLFPEIMRDDLHQIRSVVEAHSRSSRLSGAAEASACGYDLRKNQASCLLRVFVDNAWRKVQIVRWD